LIVRGHIVYVEIKNQPISDGRQNQPISDVRQNQPISDGLKTSQSATAKKPANQRRPAKVRFLEGKVF